MTAHTAHPANAWDHDCPACAGITELQDCVAGRPRALARLRQMHAVVMAARDIVKSNLVPECPENTLLRYMLNAGGWLDA